MHFFPRKFYSLPKIDPVGRKIFRNNILKDDDSQLFAPFYDRDADGRLNSRFPSWKMSPQGSIAVYIGTLLKPSKRETGNNQEFEAD